MSNSTHYHTIIIGGGLAGIATALRRKKRGERVMVIEKNEEVGGKLAEYTWNNFRWDKGPSLFTLPHLVTELFELFGQIPEDHFDYYRIPESCRYFYEDGTDFGMHGDPEARKEELKIHFTEEEVTKVERYLDKAATNYEVIGELFIDRPKLGWKDALRSEIVKQYPKLLSKQLIATLHQFNTSQFQDEKLVQLFNRFGTYNGSDPYKMSGLYSMIPHLELNRGTYFPKGGMRAIIKSLAGLAQMEGVSLLTKEDQVKVIADSDTFRVLTKQGILTSDKVVSAIDHLNFYRHVLEDQEMTARYEKQQKSSSAVVFYWAISDVIEKIGLHTIFFSNDYRKEFASIFQRREIPEQPTIYVHNSSCVEQTDAPEGCQNWFVMINTPAGIEPSTEEIEQLEEWILKRLLVNGIDIRNKILHSHHWTMSGISADTGADQGALYGPALNTRMAPFKRHGNQNKKYKQLYFCGGTVHPGGGIPLVLKSAKIVDQLMENHGKIN